MILKLAVLALSAGLATSAAAQVAGEAAAEAFARRAKTLAPSTATPAQAQAANAAVSFVKANKALFELTSDLVSIKNVTEGNRWGGGRDYFVTLKVPGESIAGIPVESLILRVDLADVGNGIQVVDAKDCYWRRRLPAVLKQQVTAEQAEATILRAGVQAVEASGALVPLIKKDFGLGAALVLTPAGGDEDVVPYRLAWRFPLPRRGEFLYASAVTGAWLYTRQDPSE